MHPAKVCIYGNLHSVALKLFCWVYLGRGKFGLQGKALAGPRSLVDKGADS